MNSGPRRGVTRGYVGGLIGASVIVALSVTVAAWGMIALGTGREPIATENVARWIAPGLVAVSLVLLAAMLWQQALILLKGQRSPAWGLVIVMAGGAYLVWCLGGMLAGMSIDETWVSPFAAVLPVTWGIVSFLFWAVLARRVYTDRPRPRWPWETEDE